MAAVKPTQERGRRLTTDAVVTAAVGVVDRDGVDGLTIRALAASLGVTPMAIYRHVRDKDELLDRVVDAILVDVARIELSGSPREQLTALFGEVRRILLDHPGVAALSVFRSTPVPGVLRFYDRVLAILDDAGVSPPEAVLAFDSLLMFMFGSVLWQGPRRETERERLLRLAALSADAVPNLLGRGRDIAHRDPDRYWAYGLNRLLDGIAVG